MTTIKGDANTVQNTSTMFTTTVTGWTHAGSCSPGCDCVVVMLNRAIYGTPPVPSPTTLRQGWECPRCKAVLAPFTASCVNCKGELK